MVGKSVSTPIGRHFSENGVLQGISVNRQPVDAACLILAIGHSARDTFRMLAGQGFLWKAKPFP